MNRPDVGATSDDQKSQSDHQWSPGGDQQSDRQSDQQSDHGRSLSLMNDSPINNQQSNKGRGDAAEAQKERIRKTLQSQGIDTTDLLSHVGSSWLDQGRIDVSNFPEPYQITIERFCRLWRVPAPEKVGGKSGAFGDWINGARDLMTAYGEYGPELLDVVYWSGDWLREDGTPMTIGRPTSVLKFTSAWCGRLRMLAVRPGSLDPTIEMLREKFLKKASPGVLETSSGTYEERLAERQRKAREEHGQ